ncbi:helix-turn-helix transcriptional regulator [Micromonospora sp. NPDC005174]|uniref:helix-turn-helix domain-containing protein n=1 Tax=Micromonospora sp. NPDC005174 TaxID=3157018 RepID=UPI0033A51D75
MSQAAPPNRLRELREAAGMSQQEVADAITTRSGGQVSTTAGTVSRWERGVAPLPLFRRALADVFGVKVAQLGIPSAPLPRQRSSAEDEWFMGDEQDPRVQASQDEWRRVRRLLNANRHALAQTSAGLYGSTAVTSTGLIAGPGWIPDAPVDLADVTIAELPDAAPPLCDGSEREAARVLPDETLMRTYPRYTRAIRDLMPPRLFEDRHAWRLLDVDWSQQRIGFGDTTYFGCADVFEAVAHELAYVALDADGLPASAPALRDLPYRRLVGSPFDLSRRPVMPAISTLTIRRDGDRAEFLMHRRDPRAVTAAGGMLQVIPSGIFQPSSLLPAARAADFDLWRNIQREFSEELLGLAEADGHGQPVDYGSGPFAVLDEARASGRLRVHCLGVALDALTLVGEILTVLVVDADVFDSLAADFVDRNDEGQVVAERFPFTEDGVRSLLDSGKVAPAGAGCLELAWQWRHVLLPSDGSS